MSQIKTKYIADNQVTNAKLAQIGAHSYKGNNTGSTANVADITNTQLTADLNQFTSSLQGVVPGSGGGTTNFLRADGTWAAPNAVTPTSVTLNDNTTNGTIISTAVASATIYIVRYSMTRSTAVEVGILYVTSDGSSTANVSGGGGQLSLTDAGVTFSAVVTGGNLVLRYTTTSTGSNATFKYLLDSWVA